MNDLYAEFAAGKTVFREGDAGAEMYIVERGVVEITRAGGGSDPVALLEVGDFFGEMAILEDLPRNASAVAKSDCRLLRIERASFADLLAQNVEIAVRIMRKLAARQRQAEQTVTRLRADLTQLQAGAPIKVAASAAPPAGEQNAKSARAEAKPAVPAVADPGVPKPAKPNAKPAPTAPVSEAVQPPPAARPPAAAAVPKPAAAPRPASVAADAPISVPVAPVAAAPAAPASVPPAPPAVCILLHPATGQKFPLEGATAEFLIGRTDPVTGITPEINLGGLDTSRSLSRRHAKLLTERGVYSLREEVGTANGTYVNGQKLAAGVTVPLKPGDKLRFGSIEMELATA